MLRTEDGMTVIKKNFSPLVLFTLIALLSCGQKVNSVILDTDIGSSTDDLFAMQLLYHYADSKEIKLIGIIVDREGQENAYLADLMNTYYGYEEVPIGLVRNGIKNPKIWIDYKKLPEWKNKNADKTEEKNLIFPYTCYDESYPDGYKLYRELLASQPDKSVVVCSIGFLTCLSQLLKSQADEYSDLDGVELVKRKVKAIYLMGGVFNGAIEKIEYNFSQGIDFVQDFFALLPSEVDLVFSPGEVGDALDYKVENVISDISWTDTHPIKQVYLNCNCNTGQKMWDVLPVINAVKGDDWFVLSPRGRVEVLRNTRTIFTPDPKGNYRYQIPGDEAWAQKIFAEIKKSYGRK